MTKKEKKELKIKKEKESAKIKRDLLKKYVSIMKNVRIFPTRADLLNEGISRDKVRYHFSTLKKMREAAKVSFPKAFKGVVDTDDLKLEDLSRYKRFVITTAVNGQYAHKGFIKSLENYCEIHKAKLLILPSNDPAHNLDNEIEWYFDNPLLDKDIIFDDLKLNSNIHISSLRVNAKQINPTTGLGRISQGKGSFVFASPKQSLEFDPVSSTKLPHARMSTGACTIANYSSSKGNSQRTAFLADHDHILGAVIVEIRNDEIYHFRQIQADSKGKYIELGY